MTALSMTKAAPAPWQQIYVRHVVVDRRADITSLRSIVKPAFESSSVGSQGASPRIFSRPSGRWLIGAGFPDTDWVPLFTNYQTATELFACNSGNKRLEVVLTGYDPAEQGWFFWLNQGGKPKVRFSQSAAVGSSPQIEADAALAERVAACSSAQAGWQVLCQQFDVPENTRRIVVQDDQFVVLGKNGKPVKTPNRGIITYHGSELVAGENPAADQLNEAIEKGDAQAVRAAVAAGASLDVLPDSSNSPLLVALFNWFEPGSPEVAETLLELGASVDGRDEKNSPLLDLMHNFVQEELALPTAEFLLQHGANVNATDESGKPALFNAVVYPKPECVRLLRQYGADPQLGGTLEWLQQKMERTANITELEPLGQMLALLTGIAWQPPAIPELAPEFQAENARFQQVHELWQIEQMLKNGFQIRPTLNEDLTHQPVLKQWHDQLKQLGFQRACQIDLWIGFHCRAWLVLTDPQRKMDALLTLSGEDQSLPRLDIGVYHPGWQVTTAGNREQEQFLGYVPPNNDFTCLPDADAVQLVAFLEQKLAGSSREVLPIDPQSFETRYQELTELELQGMLGHLQAILETPPDSSNGKALPRYERLRCYFRNTDNDPVWSTARLTEYSWKELSQQRDAHSQYRAIRAAVDLALLQHLQVAGADYALDFLTLGCQQAVQLFENEAASAKPYQQNKLTWELEEALLLTTLAGDWDSFTRLCEALRPRFAQAEYHTDEVTAAQFWLVVASAFRKKKIPGAGQLPEQIRAIRKKRYPLLLKVWEAIEARSQPDFETALLASLQYQKTLQSRADSLYDLRELLAIPESILYQIARHQGLIACDLAENLKDRLLRPESLQPL